jgi:hypothetical protein
MGHTLDKQRGQASSKAVCGDEIPSHVDIIALSSDIQFCFYAH